jgi:hypothetical protein
VLGLQRQTCQTGINISYTKYLWAMIAAITLLLVGIASSQAFYLPGVAPYDFKRGETVDLKVNKLRCVCLHFNLKLASLKVYLFF